MPAAAAQERSATPRGPALPDAGAAPRPAGRAGRVDRVGAGRHALLAGGGTGGHVFPALAVAEVLAARGWRVSFAGLAGGLESRLAPERGIDFHPLPARPVLGRGVAAKVLALGTLARSAVAAARLVRRLGASVVMGTGGYVSAPAVVGGRLARRPVLLLEPNAHPGLANRWLSRCATAAAVGYGETARHLHCPVVVTGVPVRRAFFEVPAVGEPAPAGGAPGSSGPRNGPGLDSTAAGAPPAGEESAERRLLVLGGSQGARQINQALPAVAARLLAAMPGLCIVHQAGGRNVEETRAAYAAAGVPAERARVVPFLDDVAAAMAESHLLVSRAGAITVAEICAAGRGALLVPLAIAEGHQVANARLLAEAGGAELLAAADLEPAPFAGRLLALLGDGARLAAMGRAARALARPNAAAAIAAQLEDLAGGGGAAGAMATGAGAGGAGDRA
jgi:UDP-N-acetylglucosamine--N-acetylmuramyl-(pentapeptide) pyrophosphoryl-undecaprenol N-acetylglucosamine transferase